MNNPKLIGINWRPRLYSNLFHKMMPSGWFATVEKNGHYTTIEGDTRQEALEKARKRFAGLEVPSQLANG